MTRSEAPDRPPLVAITGATGFLGRHVIAALADEGWRLSLLVRRDPGKALRMAADFAAALRGVRPERDREETGGRSETGSGHGLPGPEPVIAPPPALSDVEIVQGDLADAAALARLVDGAEAIVHLAGAIKARDLAGFMAANAEGTARLAEARQAHAPGARVVMVSSLAAREPGLSPYAASKRAGEARLAEIAGDDGVAILRPAAVYGPGDRETLALFRAAELPAQPLLNGPEARLALIHARDVARAVTAALGADLRGAVWELGDARPEGHAWSEIVRAAAGAAGRRPRPVRLPRLCLAAAGHIGDIAARISGRPAMLGSGKVREILHPDWQVRAENRPPSRLWQPEIELDQGFADTVAWYRRHGWL